MSWIVGLLCFWIVAEILFREEDNVYSAPPMIGHTGQIPIYDVDCLHGLVGTHITVQGHLGMYTGRLLSVEPESGNGWDTGNWLVQIEGVWAVAEVFVKTNVVCKTSMDTNRSTAYIKV